MNARCLILALCALSVGCDPISGVNTTANLTDHVDYECVDRAIGSVPGVGEVELHENQDETYQILPYRGKVISKEHLWTYGPDQTASLQLIDDGLKIAYSNGMMKMGPPWPALRLDAFVPLMMRVNATVARDCNLPINIEGKIERS